MSVWDSIVAVVKAGVSAVDSAASQLVNAAQALASGQLLDAIEDLTDAAFDTANAEFGTAIAEVASTLHAIGQPVETIGMGLLASMDPGQQVGSTINDVLKGNWRAIVTKIEADVAYVPILGTAAANVIASGLALYDQLSSPGGRAKVILLAYDFALANVPGAAAFQAELDPLVTALVRLAVGGEPPTDAVLDALVQSVSDPIARSILSALVLLLTHRQTIAQTGLDLADAVWNQVASFPVVDQGSEAVAELLAAGKSAADSLTGALDAVAADPAYREAWDNFRADYKQVAAQYPALAEEVTAFAVSNGLSPDLVTAAQNAAVAAVGQEEQTTAARLQKMLAASRPYRWALAIEAKGTAQTDATIDALVSANALLPVASRALASDAYAADPSGGPVYALLVAAEPARPLLNGVVGSRVVPAGKQAVDAFADVLGVSL